MPWYAKALLVLVIAYALSPIDLIPDFIPVLGLLDDLLVVPLGVLVARWMIPAAVMAECRARADARLLAGPRRAVTLVVVGIALAWVALAILLIAVVARVMGSLGR